MCGQDIGLHAIQNYFATMAALRQSCPGSAHEGTSLHFQALHVILNMRSYSRAVSNCTRNVVHYKILMQCNKNDKEGMKTFTGKYLLRSAVRIRILNYLKESSD